MTGRTQSEFGILRDEWDDFADSLGLDEFQRIAALEIGRELSELIAETPAPGSHHERLLMQLGAVIDLKPGDIS